MIKVFNEDDYNIEKDGVIRNLDGNFMFIPYMKGINDVVYNKFLEELLKLDWLHYKLYLVGGILEGWNTTDIDICITGKRDKQLPELMNKARKLGPFDMYWVKSLEKIKGNGSRVWKFAKSHDRWGPKADQWSGTWKKDGLFHMSDKFTIKNNREYKKEPLLIN